uniref:Ig-like domain-containing protein n=1 Tax=Zosterops lateralis melanops TaxID=1220523 RepID=A0A8D2QUR1_ZOSLA
GRMEQAPCRWAMGTEAVGLVWVTCARMRWSGCPHFWDVHSVPMSYLLVLQVPAWALLNGDRMTLRCRSWQDSSLTWVSFYREEKELQLLRDGKEMSLSPLQLHHSGRYRCRGWVDSEISWGWKESAPITLFPMPVLEGPPEPTEGSPLTLSCLSTPSPLQPPPTLLHLFYRDGQLVGGPQRSPQLLVPAVGVSHSGNYSCQVHSEGGAVQKSSAQLRVTVRSECGDGHGEPSHPFRIPCPSPGPTIPSLGPHTLPGNHPPPHMDPSSFLGVPFQSRTSSAPLVLH